MTSRLLPPNATAFEQALADLAGEALDIPILVGTLWNPWTCPEPLLPWLAWAFSVDVWEDDWSEDTKRRVIAGSFEAHATKGTRAALLRALEPFGLAVDLVEWWEREHPGDPFTFDVTAWVSSTPASVAIQTGLLRTIESTKPLRAHMSSFAVGAQFGQDISIVTVGQGSDVGARTGLMNGRSGLKSMVGLVGIVTPIQQRDGAGKANGRQQLVAAAQLANVLVGESGTEGRGMLAGRASLIGQAATALVADGAPCSEGSGHAVGRRELSVVAPLVASITAFHAVEAAMPTEEPEEIMANRIVLSGATFPDMTITAINGALVLIQNGQTTYLMGRPAQPDIQQVGLVTGMAGTTAVTFSGAPGVLVVGDRLILNAAYHTVVSLAGSTLNINPPLAADMDGVAAMRFREGV